MAELVFHDKGKSKQLKDGASLAEPCEEMGVHLACGQGFCGTCIVRVREGKENLSPPTEREIDFLGEKGVQEERMACQCRILSGKVTIDA